MHYIKNMTQLSPIFSRAFFVWDLRIVFGLYLNFRVSFIVRTLMQDNHAYWMGIFQGCTYLKSYKKFLKSQKFIRVVGCYYTNINKDEVMICKQNWQRTPFPSPKSGIHG
jgi:hypothetical protein